MFSSLNPQQQKAVNAINGPVLVIAGAGTGKTQVLALRIVKILQETDANPENILCLTFTESGVVAMKRRLSSFLGTAGYRVQVFTFHSFCEQILREHPERFVFAKEMEMLDDLEKAELFQEILKELPSSSALKLFGNPEYYLYSIGSLIQALKKEGITPEGFKKLVFEISEFIQKTEAEMNTFLARRANTITEENVIALRSALEIPENNIASLVCTHILLKDFSHLNAKNPYKPLKDELKKFWESLQNNAEKWKQMAELVFPAYQQKLKDRGRYDYDDMILFVLREFRRDADFLAKYRERFSYLLADEFQDTNSAQKEILELLAGDDDPNIFVVGDDDQSIYRFQGASMENILDFFHRYQTHCQIIPLEENYRSTQEILDGAKAVIDNNQHRIFTAFGLGEKRLISQKKLQQPVRIQTIELKTDEEELVFLAEEAKKHLQNGVPAEEIAILVRDNAQGSQIADFFEQYGVACRFQKSQNALEDKNLQLFLRIFSFLQTHSGEDLFFLLRAPFFNLHLLEVARFFRSLPRHAESWDALLALSEEENTDFSGLVAVRAKLLAWEQALGRYSFPDFFAFVIHDSGFYAWVLDQKNTKTIAAINGLYREIKKWASRKKSFSMADFLQKYETHELFRVPISYAYLAPQKDAVQILSMHGSKGLEFEVVLMAKCIDKKRPADKLPTPPNILKNDFTLESQMAHEDERRLFYVAMTRAKSVLVLSSFQENSEGRPVPPSPFLLEIPEILREAIPPEPIQKKAYEVLPTLFLAPPLPSLPEESFQNFIREILSTFRLSPTHLNAYRECPRKFLYSTLLRVPRAKNRFSALGTAAHEVLRKIFQNAEKNSFASPHIPEALKNFEDFLEKESLNEEDFLAALKEGKGIMEEYLRHYDVHFFRTHDYLLEYDFFPHAVEIKGVPVTGRMDKIEFLNPQKMLARVVDYKTGKPENALKKDDAKRQIIFYALLCDHAPISWKMAEGELDFLVPQKNGEFIRHQMFVSDAEKEELAEEIERTGKELQSLEFLTFGEERMCGECEYCIGNIIM